MREMKTILELIIYQSKQNRLKPNHVCDKVLIIKPVNNNKFSDDFLKNSKKRVQMLMNALRKI